MNDFANCPCAGINLDKLVQPSILMCLVHSKMHGYALVQEITASPMFRGEKPDSAGIYRFLKQMESRNIVEYTWDFAETGAPKKVYGLTDEGKRCLLQWITSIEHYNASLAEFLDKARKVAIE